MRLRRSKRPFLAKKLWAIVTLRSAPPRWTA